MVKYRDNSNKGAIFVYVIILCSIIMIFATSIITLLDDGRLYRNSQINAAKSYYLAESAIDEVLNTIYGTTEDIINQYLIDLKEYKVQYIMDKNNDKGSDIRYNPPAFNNYMYIGLISKLNSLKYENKNPFEEYSKVHSYKIEAKYEASNKIIINVVGSYESARKFIRVELCMPELIEDGKDHYNLPNVKIRSMYIKSKYQTLGV